MPHICKDKRLSGKEIRVSALRWLREEEGSFAVSITLPVQRYWHTPHRIPDTNMHMQQIKHAIIDCKDTDQHTLVAELERAGWRRHGVA